ncbi:MAG: hypothetical protein WA908_01855 [Pontixanthobacter sp.]
MFNTVLSFHRTFALLLASCLMLTACGEGGAVYDIPAKEMRHKLKYTKPPMIIFGSNGVSLNGYQTGDGNIIWRGSQGGRSLFRYIATLTPVGDTQTSISLDLIGPTDDANDPINAQFAEHPGIRKLYLKAMEEAIDSKLTGRQFQMSAIQNELAAAAIAEMPNIQNQVNQAAERSAKFDREMRQGAQRAADLEWEREIEAQWQD